MRVKDLITELQELNDPEGEIFNFDPYGLSFIEPNARKVRVAHNYWKGTKYPAELIGDKEEVEGHEFFDGYVL